MGYHQCLLVDDIAIFAKSEKDQQHYLKVCNKNLELYGVKMNTRKTKIMCIGDENYKLNITINGESIE